MIEAKLLIAISFGLVIILAMIILGGVMFFYGRSEEARMNGKHSSARQWNIFGNTFMVAGLIAIVLFAIVVCKVYAL